MMQGAWLLIIFLMGVLLVIGCTLIALRTLQAPLHLTGAQRPLAHFILKAPLLDAPLVMPVASSVTGMVNTSGTTPTAPASDESLVIESLHCLRTVSRHWACLGIISNRGMQPQPAPAVTLKNSTSSRPLVTDAPLIPVIDRGASIPFRMMLVGDALSEGGEAQALLERPRGVQPDFTPLPAPEMALERIDAYGRYIVRYRLRSGGATPLTGAGVALWLMDAEGHVVGYRQGTHADEDSQAWHTIAITPYIVAHDLTLHASAWQVVDAPALRP